MFSTPASRDKINVQAPPVDITSRSLRPKPTTPLSPRKRKSKPKQRVSTSKTTEGRAPETIDAIALPSRSSRDNVVILQGNSDAPRIRSTLPSLVADEKLLTTNFVAFDVFTSDAGARELEGLITRWRKNITTQKGSDLALWNMIQSFFHAMPFVCCQDQHLTTPKFLRYVSVMTKLKQVLTEALYIDLDPLEQAKMKLEESRLPFFRYCELLKVQNAKLRSEIDDPHYVRRDTGLLKDEAALVILEYWKLDRTDRVALLMQIFASQNETTVDLFRVLLQGNRQLLMTAMNDLGFSEFFLEDPDAKARRLQLQQWTFEEGAARGLHLDNTFTRVVDTQPVEREQPKTSDKSTQTWDKKGSVSWQYQLADVGSLIASTIWDCLSDMKTSESPDLSKVTRQFGDTLYDRLREAKHMNKQQQRIVHFLCSLLFVSRLDPSAGKEAEKQDQKARARLSYSALSKTSIQRMNGLMGPSSDLRMLNEDLDDMMTFIDSTTKTLFMITQNIAKLAEEEQDEEKKRRRSTLLPLNAPLSLRLKYLNESDALNSFPDLIEELIERRRAAAADEEDDEDEQEAEKSPKPRFQKARKLIAEKLPDAFKGLFKGTKKKAKGKLALRLVYKVIGQLYRERYDSLSITTRSVAKDFVEFVYDWYLQKYGMRSLGQSHLFKFLYSIQEYMHKDLNCYMFARFIQIENCLDSKALEFFLVLFHRFPDFELEKDVSPLGIDVVRIDSQAATQYILEALELKVGTYPAVTAQLKKDLNEAQVSLRGPTVVDLDTALQISMRAWETALVEAGEMLKKLAVAADIDGDNVIRLDEFYNIVSQLSPEMTSQDVLAVYRSGARDLDYMDQEGFVDAVLHKVVLEKPFCIETNRLRKKKAIESEKTKDKEEGQFLLLEDLWREDNEFEESINNIPNQRIADNIKRRVALMKMLIKQRIDSEAAWMCHRTIMAEITRYKDLPPEAATEAQDRATNFRKSIASVSLLEQEELMNSKEAKAAESGTTSRHRLISAVNRISQSQKHWKQISAGSLRAVELHRQNLKTGKVSAEVVFNELRRELVNANDINDIEAFQDTMTKLRSIVESDSDSSKSDNESGDSAPETEAPIC